MDLSSNRARSIFNSLIGIDIVNVAGQHTLRTHLMKVLETYAIDTVVDVGASEGGFGIFIRSIGYSGAIHSFEPVASAYRRLVIAASTDNNWYAHRLALGAKNGKAMINVSRFTQMSSFLSASRYGSDNWPNLATESKEEVDVRTLEHCFSDGLIPRGRRVLLKMDTQGFDQEVFKGALPVRCELSCLLSELSLIPLYEGMPDFIQSVDSYRSSGFMVTGFFPITRNPSLALNEVDCVLVDPGRLESANN